VVTVLGARPLRGRTFGPDDPVAVAVVSERFWRDTLDAREDAVGSALNLDGDPVTILGIMPADFRFPYGAASLLPGVASEARTDLWLPFRNRANPQSRMGHVTAPLEPRVTNAHAPDDATV